MISSQSFQMIVVTLFFVCFISSRDKTNRILRGGLQKDEIHLKGKLPIPDDTVLPRFNTELDTTEMESFVCNTQYGNPCGPLHHCIVNPDSTVGYSCEINVFVDLCNVDCEEGSICIENVYTKKIKCECDFGYMRTDPYFDCFKIVSQKERVHKMETD